MSVQTVDDLGALLEKMGRRIYTLEQRITSPEYVVPNGSSPTFSSVKIGEVGNPDIVLVPTQGAVTNLNATPVTQESDVRAQVTWDAAAGAVQYEVSWYLKDLNANNWTLVGTDRTVGTSFTTPVLLPNRVYGFRVWAVNSLGRLSAPAPSATTYTQVTTGQDTTIPVALTGLIGTAGATSITVMWDESTDPDVRNQGYYEIEVSTNSDYSSPIISQTTTASIVSFTGLTAGTTYFVRVRGVDASGNAGSWSDFNPLTPTDAGGTPAPGSITDDMIAESGLSAARIKFGSMHGDRIEAKTLSVNTIGTSTLTSTTITLGTGGSIIGGATPQGPTSTGFSLSELGLRLTKAGVPTVVLDALTGDVTVTGTINATAGSFSGNLTSSATITGGSFVGATFTTKVDPAVDRATIDKDGMTIQREGTTNVLYSPAFWDYTDWKTANNATVGGAAVGGWTATGPQITTTDASQMGVRWHGLIYSWVMTRSTTGTTANSVYQDYSSQSGATTVAANQTWTWSTWLKASSAASANVAYLYVEFFNSSNVSLGSVTGSNTSTATSTTGTTQWRRCYMTVTTPAGCTKIRVAVIFPGGTSTVIYRVAGPQLELKDHMTTWAGPGQDNVTALSIAVNDSGWARATFNLFNARSDGTDNVVWGDLRGTVTSGYYRDGYSILDSGQLQFESTRASISIAPAQRYTASLYTEKVQGSGGYVSKVGLRVGDQFSPSSAIDFAEIFLWRSYGIGMYHGYVGSDYYSHGVRIGSYGNYFGHIQHTASDVSSNGNFHIDSQHNNVYLGWFGGSVNVGNGAQTWGPIYAASYPGPSTLDTKENIEPVGSVLTKIKKMRPVKYRSKSGIRTMGRGAAQREVAAMSIVAESVAESIPEAAWYWPEDTPVPRIDGTFDMKKKGDLFGIELMALSALSIAAIQELTTRLEAAEAKIAQLTSA